MDVREEAAVGADPRGPLDDHGRIDDRPGSDLGGPIDPGRSGIEEDDAAPGERLVLPPPQLTGRRPDRDGVVDREDLDAVRACGESDLPAGFGQPQGQVPESGFRPSRRDEAEKRKDVRGAQGQHVRKPPRPCPAQERERRAFGPVGPKKRFQGPVAQQGSVGRDDEDVAIRILLEQRPGREKGREDPVLQTARPFSVGQQKNGGLRLDGLDQAFPILPAGRVGAGHDQDGVGLEPRRGLERIGAERPSEDRLEDRSLFPPQKKNDG